MENKNVDIIVPIYNAYEFTKVCIETIIENTNLKENTLILINDKSTDIRISQLLIETKENNKNINIVIIENKENQGFVKTVNIGMNYSKNDVILLNSDTEVTSNWLNKLKKCAYSREMVASVTPLSNNATLASVPNYLEENVLPNYLSLSDYAKIIEESSLEVFPEIPTGHGFCMYITRKALDEVGLFDDITFEKGYGEENDFSYRAIRKGFVNIMCDNTFIYHKGTQSFSNEKEDFINNHLKLLQDKYPICFQNTTNYCANYPTGYIQDNIKYSVGNKFRKNILFLVHDFRSEEQKILGGTTLHIYDIIKKLRKDINFHVLYPDMNCIKMKSFFQNSEATINFGKINTYNKINFYNNDYKNILEDVFDLVNVDCIHIHHLLNQFLDIFDIAERKNIPIITTIHDFYMVCPKIQLMNKELKPCIIEKNKKCSECFDENMNADPEILDAWKENFHTALRKSKKIIVPSESTKKIILSEYKDLNIEVIEHGIVIDENSKKNNKNIRDFNVAFIGGINEHKGVKILKDLIKLIHNKDKIKIHLFGQTSDYFLNKSSGKYIFHGPYNRNDIVNLLRKNNIDLVCLLSICPETYSFTLSESVNAEIPVITLNVGAIAQRVSENKCGWIMDIDASEDDIYRKILEIKNNAKEYDEKLKNIIIYKDKMKTLDEMIEEYRTLYLNNLTQNKEENIVGKKYRKLLLSTSQCVVYSEINLRYQIKMKIYNKLNSFKIIRHMRKNKVVNKIWKSFIKPFLRKMKKMIIWGE